MPLLTLDFYSLIDRRSPKDAGAHTPCLPRLRPRQLALALEERLLGEHPVGGGVPGGTQPRAQLLNVVVHVVRPVGAVYEEQRSTRRHHQNRELRHTRRGRLEVGDVRS